MALYGKVTSNIAKEGTISAPQEKRIGLGWVLQNNPETPYFDKSSGFKLIKDQIKQYILTSKGERVMLPDYGTTLRNFLFEPFTSQLASIQAADIEAGFKKYIPNVNINYIRFFQSENLHGFGLPGIQIQMEVSPNKSLQVVNIKVNI
jgi:phage baseplate assembly protein W